MRRYTQQYLVGLYQNIRRIDMISSVNVSYDTLIQIIPLPSDIKLLYAGALFPKVLQLQYCLRTVHLDTEHGIFQLVF